MRSYSLELSERFGCELSGKQHLRHTAPSKNSELFPEWRRPQQPLLTQLDQLSYIVYTVEVPDEITKHRLHPERDFSDSRRGSNGSSDQ